MIIDLCSGYGRWTQDEIAIDLDPKVRPTILADIRYLPLRDNLVVDLAHASVPCTYISKARRWKMGYNPLGVAQTFELAAACWYFFASLKEGTITFEWPKGFEDFLGHKITFHYDKADIKNATTNFYSNNKSLKRAKIPTAVRQSILEAIQN